MHSLIGIKFLLKYGHFLVFKVRTEDAMFWVQQHASRGFKTRGVETIHGKCYLTGAEFSLNVEDLIAINTVNIVEALPTQQQGQVPPDMSGYKPSTN